jgi:hypothetical protein
MSADINNNVYLHHYLTSPSNKHVKIEHKVPL